MIPAGSFDCFSKKVKALEDLKEHSVSNVKLACSLYANQGKELFYEKFGFQKLPNGKYGYGMLAEL